MKKIMFSDKFGLTQAVLDGRKTMTRRVVSSKLIDKYDEWRNDVDCIALPPNSSIETLSEYILKRSLYTVGEVVAIAQRYKDVDNYYKAALRRKTSIHGMTVDPLDCISYNDIKIWELIKDSLIKTTGWGNKMFVKSELMPHHIIITDIKIERLQDISEEDFLKEGGLIGVDRFKTPNLGVRGYLTSTDYKDCFQFMIDKVQGKGTWNSNPYVWAYEFELID